MASWWRRNQVQPAITAPIILKGANPASTKNIARRQTEWQKRIHKFADSIPEVANTGSYVHNVLNRVQFKVEGDIDDPIREILERGLSTFRAGRIAENIHYVGEAILSYEYDPESGRTSWEDYSQVEAKVGSGGTLLLLNSEGEWIPQPGVGSVFSIRRRDRARKTASWSPHKSMLDMLEAWYLHQLVDARLATSRLAGAGVMHIPSDDLPSKPLTGDGVPAKGSREEWIENFVGSMLEPITDANSEDAVIPFLHFGKAEFADAIKHIAYERVDDPNGFKSRIDAYAERYARGVDLPVEIVLGSGDANHWTAWKIDDDTWKYHLAPAAERIANALTKNYAQPLVENLVDAGGLQAHVNVVPDGSSVITRPDRTEAAIQLRRQFVITKEAAALAAGFTLDDIDPVKVQPGAAIGDENVALSAHGPPVTAQAAPGTRLLQEIARLLGDGEHELQAVLQKLHETWFPKIQKAQVEAVTAAASDELLAQYEDEIRKAVRLGRSKQVGELAEKLGLSRREAFNKYDDLILERANTAAKTARDTASRTISNAVAKGKDVRIPPGLTRNVIQISHGGTDLANPTDTTLTSRPFDYGQDPITQDIMAEGGAPRFLTKYTWVRGAPENPFDPWHTAIEGAEWTSDEDESEVLGMHPWNPSGRIFPGDHVGCLCSYDIEFVEA